MTVFIVHPTDAKPDWWGQKKKKDHLLCFTKCHGSKEVIGVGQFVEDGRERENNERRNVTGRMP